MTVYTIGIDPGDSTGIAVFQDAKFVLAKQGEPKEMLTYLEVVLSHVGEDDRAKIAIERFTSNQRHTSHQPVAQQVIGAVETVAGRYGVPVVQQGAADARGLTPDGDLRSHGLWVTGGDVGRPDANDANMAIRHALLLLAGEHATWFESLLGVTG